MKIKYNLLSYLILFIFKNIFHMQNWMENCISALSEVMQLFLVPGLFLFASIQRKKYLNVKYEYSSFKEENVTRVSVDNF